MSRLLSSSPRRAFTRTAGVLFVAVAAASCSEALGPGAQSTPITALPRALTALEQQAITSSNSFGWNLLREVAELSQQKNVVISPLSASIALGMAYSGASGTTEEAMRDVLGWGAMSREDVLDAYRNLPALITGLDPKVTVGVANAMWVKQTFNVLPSYTADMQTYFNAEVRQGDFGAATIAEMNSWAASKTNGRIPKVVEELDPDLVLMLMNALYFNGEWRSAFDVSRTQATPFVTSSGATITVQMMTRMMDSLRYASGFGAQWAELPYGNTAYNMTLILPNAGSTPEQWMASAPSNVVELAVAQLSPTRLELGVPKFKLSVDYQLRAPLTRMGMGVAFDPMQSSFTRIAPAPRLVLSHVKQDVFIDVHERGTEAAAVTQVGVMPTSAPMPLLFDRPFVFLIRERLSGTVLFAGVIRAPAY